MWPDAFGLTNFAGPVQAMGHLGHVGPPLILAQAQFTFGVESNNYMHVYTYPSYPSPYSYPYAHLPVYPS